MRFKLRYVGALSKRRWTTFRGRRLNHREEYCFGALVFQARTSDLSPPYGAPNSPASNECRLLPGCPDPHGTLFLRLSETLTRNPISRSDELDSNDELVSIAVLITYDRIQIRSQDGNMIFSTLLRNKVSQTFMISLFNCVSRLLRQFGAADGSCWKLQKVTAPTRFLTPEGLTPVTESGYRPLL